MARCCSCGRNRLKGPGPLKRHRFLMMMMKQSDDAHEGHATGYHFVAALSVNEQPSSVQGIWHCTEFVLLCWRPNLLDLTNNLSRCLASYHGLPCSTCSASGEGPFLAQTSQGGYSSSFPSLAELFPFSQSVALLLCLC